MQSTIERDRLINRMYYKATSKNNPFQCNVSVTNAGAATNLRRDHACQVAL